MSVDHRPELPIRYSWQECKSIRASFPKPEGWFYKSETRPGTFAHFITQECIDKAQDPQDAFKTGLTVNVFPRLYSRFRRHPSEFAMSYMKTQKQLIPEGRTMVQQDGPLLVCRGRFRFLGGIIGGRRVERTRYYIEVTGNNETDAAYIIMFESPDVLWEQHRNIGEVIIHNRILDKSF